MQRANGRKLPDWHQHRIQIIASNGMSPRSQGREEIWIGDRGWVTYWHERGETIPHDLSLGEPSANPCDTVFPEIAAALLFGLPNSTLFEPLWLDSAPPTPVKHVVEIEAVANKQLNFGQKITRRVQKFYKRARAAVEAAWREFEQAE
ncbi:MAG: hypothetical protein AAFY11_01050 [Cyanobacteria bacterium J06641_5]